MLVVKFRRFLFLQIVNLFQESIAQITGTSTGGFPVERTVQNRIRQVILVIVFHHDLPAIAVKLRRPRLLVTDRELTPSFIVS